MCHLACLRGDNITDLVSTLSGFFSRMEVVLHEYKYGPLSKLGASIISKCISIIVAATGFSKRKEKEAR